MLLELNVKNFAIIDSIHISFREGLNILSGETGSGKSVLLKSLALLMGGKASTDLVRTGAESAEVQGLFDISERPDIQRKLREMSIDNDDDHLIVRRTVSDAGKSKIYINSTLSTLSNLMDIVSPLLEVTGDSAPLIELTGQHESKSLMSKAYHLQVLDRYSHSTNVLGDYQKLYLQSQSWERELIDLREQASLKAQRLDFLSFQREEIASMNLKENEEIELEQNFSRVKNSQKITDFLSRVDSTLLSDDDSVVARLQKVVQLSNEMRKYDLTFSEKAEMLTQAANLVDDYLRAVQTSDISDADGMDLNSLEERMSQFRKLQKKYGNTSSEILAQLADIEKQITDLESSDERIQELSDLLKNARTDLVKLADKLHKTRLNAAKILSDSVNDELKDLNMKGLIFEVKVVKLTDLNTHGCTDVEFLVRAGKNEESRPLAKTASGGELSRILLSLKNVVGNSDYNRTYLFDEVDTGVSGETAEKVGRKLRQIARGQQVICVTHLPQVASFGNVHFLIDKDTKGKKVNMSVVELDKKERVQEIARLISGEKITKTSLAHANELLKESQI